MSGGNSLARLSAVLRGGLPAEGEWPALLELANRAWLVPALFVALRGDGRLQQIPGEVRDYLALLHERNRERNLRMRTQLFQTVAALNGAGIAPVLLKGAVLLHSGPEDSLGGRMISDLDLSIAPGELVPAADALAAIGYRAISAREFGRPEDTAEVELHTRPDPRSANYLSGDLRDSSRKTVRNGAACWIPSPTARALHLIVHDMIKEGHYWRLRLDLRRLHDLAALACSVEGVDWRWLEARLGDPPGRGALLLQLMALETLYGISVTIAARPSPALRLRHQARLRIAERDLSGAAARALGTLLFGIRRLGYVPFDRTVPRRAIRALAVTGRGSRL